MYVLVSPAKRLNLDVPPVAGRGSPAFLDDAAALADRARELSIDELKGLMGISDKLAELFDAVFLADFHGEDWSG